MSKEMRPLILTHNDLDGWLAGAIALRAWLDAEVRCVQYGMPCPVDDARGRAVAVLDFSWPVDQMAALAVAAGRLVWIDHHPASVADVETGRFSDAVRAADVDGLGANISATMSTDRCGAWLAWEHWIGCRPDAARPWIVDIVDDHDRWVHAQQDTQPVVAALHAAVGAAGPTWAGWDQLLDCTGIDAIPLDDAQPEHVQHERDRLVNQGMILLFDRATRVQKAVKQATLVGLDGYRTLIVNAPPDIISDLGHALCQQPGCDVGWVWSVGVQGGQPRVFHSLRSAQDGPAVNEMCKRRGGGGHPHAAGWAEAFPGTLAILVPVDQDSQP